MFSPLRNCSILLITIAFLTFTVPATAQTITGSIRAPSPIRPAA